MLKFNGENRPARRYLYFRFIITVLHAIHSGNDEFISELKEKGNFWTTPGKYLQRATLVALARYMTRHDLPEFLYRDTTFPDVFGSQNPLETAVILNSDLRDATIETAKKREQVEDPEYEDSEVESDEEMID